MSPEPLGDLKSLGHYSISFGIGLEFNDFGDESMRMIHQTSA